MPRAISKTPGYTPEFQAMSLETVIAGDNNDCAVKAVAIATGQPLYVVRDMMSNLGRKTKKGTSFNIIHDALRLLGFNERIVAPFDFIRRYPGVHSRLISVTTHHPERFNKVWKDGRTYLLYTRGHVLAVKDGVNHDWTKGKAKRVWQIVEVTPKEQLV